MKIPDIDDNAKGAKVIDLAYEGQFLVVTFDNGFKYEICAGEGGGVPYLSVEGERIWQPLTTTRPLSAITEDEAKEAFRVSLSLVPTVLESPDLIVNRGFASVEVSFKIPLCPTRSIVIYGNGTIMAMGRNENEQDQYPLIINFVRLVDYLHGIGIQFE